MYTHAFLHGRTHKNTIGLSLCLFRARIVRIYFCDRNLSAELSIWVELFWINYSKILDAYCISASYIFGLINNVLYEKLMNNFHYRSRQTTISSNSFVNTGDLVEYVTKYRRCL